MEGQERRQSFEKKICCIGAGYVGGTTMAVIAKHCPSYKVTIVDIDLPRISAWNSDELPIFEPQLQETITEARKTNANLFFSTEVAKEIEESEIIFISVSTPTKQYGRGAGKSFDMTSWEAVSRSIARAARGNKVIVEKSTVPVGTADKVRTILNANKVHADFSFQIISNPEFLAEGSAILDLEDPMRVLIGGERTAAGERAIEEIVAIYSHWVPKDKIITTNLWTSELSKLASNAILAQRISTMNAISAICEETGADVGEVSTVLGMDGRIGNRYLSASVGFGGSCLKKDVMALTYIAESLQLYQVAEYFQRIVDINEFQKERFSVRILETMYGTVRNKKLAILGFAFKKNTGDTRETPAYSVVKSLLEEGAIVHIFDPKVPHEEIRSYFPKEEKRLVIDSDHRAATDKAHAIILITDWDEFKTYDYKSIFETMPKPAFFFDGRNIINHEQLEEIGYHVHVIGKKSKHEFTHVVL